MPTKKKATTKKTSKLIKPSDARYAVKLRKDTDNFWDFKFSVQSLYWVLIGVGIIGTAIINFNTNAQLRDFLNEIDREQESQSLQDLKSSLDYKHEKKSEN